MPTTRRKGMKRTSSTPNRSKATKKARQAPPTRRSGKRTTSSAKSTPAAKKARKTKVASPEQQHIDELATASNVSEVHTAGAKSPAGAAPAPKKKTPKRPVKKTKAKRPATVAKKSKAKRTSSVEAAAPTVAKKSKAKRTSSVEAAAPTVTKKSKAKRTSSAEAAAAPARKKLQFSRGKSGRSFAGGKSKQAFIDQRKFATMHPKVRKLLSSQQLYGKHQWKMVRVACDGEDSFSLHSACNYNASRALGLVDNGLCIRVLQSVLDKEFRPYEDGSSGVSQKKLDKDPDTKVSELHFDGTMADSEAATFFLQTIGELLFLFNVPFVFCKGFWAQHLKVAHEEEKPSAARKSMVETAPLAGIVGAPDETFVKDFAEELLQLNEGDDVACAWVKARCESLVTFAKAAADPEAFDLASDTKEARLLFDELKKLKAKHRKDRRFDAITNWKLAGFLEQDPDDKLSCLPSLVLPSTAEEDDELLEEVEEDGDDEIDEYEEEEEEEEEDDDELDDDDEEEDDD